VIRFIPHPYSNIANRQHRSCSFYAQVTGDGGFLVEDAEIVGLAAALQAPIDEIVRATQLQMLVRLVGGRIGRTPGVARMNLDGLDEVGATMGHLLRPGRLIVWGSEM
jgi:hypothetical protein